MKSLLFVPGEPKMMRKISEIHGDAFILDLEDSVNEADKQQALTDVCDFLASGPDKKIYIRVAENHLEEEFRQLSAYRFQGYMIPKFEKPEDYTEYQKYFADREVIALVETPLGIVNLREIASCPFVTMIAFGAEDYTSAIGMKNCAETLQYARGAIVTFGKAFHKAVYDTPSFVIDDTAALEQEIQTAVDMGFDGKLSIHPAQVERINSQFQYYDLDSMRRIVAEYEKKGAAVLRVDDKVYEKMHIAHFKRILKEHGIN